MNRNIEDIEMSGYVMTFYFLVILAYMHYRSVQSVFLVRENLTLIQSNKLKK